MPPSRQEKTRPRSSFIQFHGPVRLAEELGPASNPNIVPCVEWSPGRANRHFPQRHVRFGRRTVSLTLVALQAGQNTILPRAGSAARSWLHVVECEFFASRLSTTVLTGEPVTLVDVPPTEAHMPLRKVPVRPTWRPLYARHDVRIGSWSKFLSEAYWTVELDE